MFLISRDRLPFFYPQKKYRPSNSVFVSIIIKSPHFKLICKLMLKQTKASKLRPYLLLFLYIVNTSLIVPQLPITIPQHKVNWQILPAHRFQPFPDPFIDSLLFVIHPLKNPFGPIAIHVLALLDRALLKWLILILFLPMLDQDLLQSSWLEPLTPRVLCM